MCREGTTAPTGSVAGGIRASWLILGLLLTAALGMVPIGLLTQATAAEARPTGLRHCQDLSVGTLDAVSVKANYGCRSARKNLKRLLRNGVGALPARRSVNGRWSCRKEGATYICKKSRRGTFALRVQFRTSSAGAAPQDCLDRWNPYIDHAFPRDGDHFYFGHNVRQAWVFHMTDGTRRCAVVFVVPFSDAEYGFAGETENKTRNGWILMNSLDAFGSVDSIDVQTKARDRANARLNSLGELASP